MKKNIRNIIIGAAAVVVLVAMLIILLNLPSNGDDSQSSSDTSISLNTKTSEDISQVTITNDSGSYVVELGDSENLTVEGLDGFELDRSALSAVQGDCAGISATQVVEEEAADLSIYGLDNPVAQADIEYKDGETISLAVGNQAAGSAGTYVMVNGEKKVYLFANTQVASFSYGLLDYISTTVTPTQTDAMAAFNGGEVSSSESGETQTPQLARLTFSGTVRAEPIVITQGGESVISSLVSYNMTSPKNRMADTQAISEYEQCIYGVSADRVVAINPTDEELETYGLKEPYSQLVADYDIGTVTLIASAPDSDGNIYVMNGDKKNVVYQMAASALTWLEDDYTDMDSSLLFIPNIKDVKTLTVETTEKTYEFNLTSVETGENDSFTTTILYEGKELDEEIFKDYYQNLISVSNDEETTDEPTGDPVLSVTYEYTDSSRSPDTVALYPADSRRVYVVLNGKCESLTYETYVDKILQDTEKAINGEEITSTF